MNKEEFYLRAALISCTEFENLLVTTLGEIMAQVDDIQAALTTLVGDTSTALADIATKVAALEADVDDPTKVQAVLTDIANLDASVKAADPGAAPVVPPVAGP